MHTHRSGKDHSLNSQVVMLLAIPLSLPFFLSLCGPFTFLLQLYRNLRDSATLCWADSRLFIPWMAISHTKLSWALPRCSLQSQTWPQPSCWTMRQAQSRAQCWAQAGKGSRGCFWQQKDKAEQQTALCPTAAPCCWIPREDSTRKLKRTQNHSTLRLATVLQVCTLQNRWDPAKCWVSAKS